MSTHEIKPAEMDTAENNPIQVLNPLDLPTDQFQKGLERRKQNRSALLDSITQALVEGVDYGRIKMGGRMSKPSLFKPGAEKICAMLGVIIRYPSLPDYEQAALNGSELKQIIIRCEILDTASHVITDGVGARTVQQDRGDINKALKMAEKSAHIDATLRLAGLSEVFTQDIEDMQSNNASMQIISSDQHKKLEDRIKELGLNRDQVTSWLIKASKGHVTSFLQLTPTLYERLYGKLEQFAGGAS